MSIPQKKPIWKIGIDEVGRGPLAGPVYVCAVAIRSVDYARTRWCGLTDSKKLSSKKREDWHRRAKELEQRGIIRIAIAHKSARHIDQNGITQCITDCIGSILQKLDIDPMHTRIFLDGGLKAPLVYIHQKTIIKGDQKEKIISFASVVAKVTRDAYMTKIAKKYPQYDWEKNKGYGTKNHISKICLRGPSSLHRKTYLKRILDNIV